MKKSNILTVIPAHNEAETIYEVVTRTLKHSDVSVTDDGSRDATPGILQRIREECHAGRHPHHLNVITHEKATHIPGGLQDGLHFGVEHGYEWIITMDAGLSHDPDALPEFIKADHHWDVVIGSRKTVEGVPAYRRVVSKSAAMVMNYALSRSFLDIPGPEIRDTTSGFRRYSHRASRLIAYSKLKSRMFDFHMEALAMCVRSGMSATEIPITYLFSNSSFNRKVLMQGIRFGLEMVKSKGIPPHITWPHRFEGE